MRKILLIVAILIGAVVGYFAYQFQAKGIALELTEQQLQEQIEPKFPIERNLLVLNVAFSNPKVQLKEGSDRIHISTDASATVPTQTPWKGSAEFSGRVEYNADEGQLYMQDAQIDQLNLPGVPDQYIGQVKEIGTAVAREYLNRFPIYKLDPANYQHALARLFVRSVSVENQRLRIVFGD